jgi:ankyrin repeat protein
MELPPLHEAARRRDADEVIRLIDKEGADVNEVFGEFELTPLYYAVMNDDLQMAIVLINKGANIDHVFGDTDRTVLVISISNLDMLRLLIVSGANVNAGDRVPLYIAFESGNKEAARILLAAGATAHGNPYSDYYSPFQAAIRQGITWAVRMLLDAGAAVTRAHVYNAFLAAIDNKHYDTVRLLLRANAPDLLKRPTSVFERKVQHSLRRDRRMLRIVWLSIRASTTGVWLDKYQARYFDQLYALLYFVHFVCFTQRKVPPELAALIVTATGATSDTDDGPKYTIEKLG